MVHTTSIQCPVCGPGKTIEIEVSTLLKGAQFACATCGSLVAIQQESVETARKAIDEFENLRNLSKNTSTSHR